MAGGVERFDDLQRSLRVSRRTLAERLRWLVEAGVLHRRRYQERPERFAYALSETGRGLLPVLVALQDFGSRFVLGDGTLSATGSATSAEAQRVHGLLGAVVPVTALSDASGSRSDPGAPGGWSVLYAFPGAFPPGMLGHPPGWDEIPGAAGCTLEATTYRDRLPAFTAAGVAVRGVSTQRPDQLAAFSAHLGLGFPLLSDAGGELAVGLRLPTFRAGGLDRLKRLTLVIDPSRVIRGVLYPITDPAGSIDDALAVVRGLMASADAVPA